MIELISQPWHWSISGLMIIMVMYLLIWMGQRFGVSSSFRALCAAGGGKSVSSYFDYDWKTHGWLLFFVAGSIIGGYFASNFLASDMPIQISQSTIADLQNLGVSAPAVNEFVPSDLFSISTLSTAKGIILFVVGGFLIGFGTRYADGCTSGHAITGLSNLQLPSLVAVVGFFIGGLVMTHFLLPYILKL